MLIHVISAILDDDFMQVNDTTLAFPAGMTVATFPFGIFNDDINEALESFSAMLSLPTNGLSLGMISTARVDIINDDGK